VSLWFCFASAIATANAPCRQSAGPGREIKAIGLYSCMRRWPIAGRHPLRALVSQREREMDGEVTVAQGWRARAARGCSRACRDALGPVKKANDSAALPGRTPTAKCTRLSETGDWIGDETRMLERCRRRRPSSDPRCVTTLFCVHCIAARELDEKIFHC
jgi:hypothetical protein